MTKKEKEQVVFDEAVHGQALRDMIKEASGNKLKAESYLELNKDIKDRAKKELGVEGKLFNQLLALFHKGTRDRFETEKDEVVEAYDSIFA